MQITKEKKQQTSTLPLKIFTKVSESNFQHWVHGDFLALIPLRTILSSRLLPRKPEYQKTDFTRSLIRM
jgi:hypothetical protein